MVIRYQLLPLLVAISTSRADSPSAIRLAPRADSPCVAGSLASPPASGSGGGRGESPAKNVVNPPLEPVGRGPDRRHRRHRLALTCFHLHAHAMTMPRRV